MTVTIVTEGQTDARIISGALRDRQDVRVIAASGRSAADSWARSVLAASGDPVVLVVDADTLAGLAALERRSFHESSLGQIASKSRWSVFLISPEVEALLFQAPGVSRQLFGELSDGQRMAAQYAPKQVAAEALKDTPLVDALGNLGESEWQEIRNLPDMRRILDSVDQLQQNGAARPSTPQ